MLVESKENKLSIVYSNNKLYFFDLFIPDNLVKELAISKEDILLYHSEPYKIKRTRGKVTLDRLNKELQQEIKKGRK